jgi:hypothetical protein
VDGRSTTVFDFDKRSLTFSDAFVKQEPLREARVRKSFRNEVALEAFTTTNTFRQTLPASICGFDICGQKCYLRIKFSADMCGEILVRKFIGRRGISAAGAPFKTRNYSFSARKNCTQIRKNYTQIRKNYTQIRKNYTQIRKWTSWRSGSNSFDWMGRLSNFICVDIIRVCRYEVNTFSF